jgi:two-component sensor histidine kinase
VRDAEGRIIGASKIARDITERRRAQEKQGLLLREMNHRVKNLFALASGLVTLSTRFAHTPEELAALLRARLLALSRAHDLTLPYVGDGRERADSATGLNALIKTIVSPYETPKHGGDERVRAKGPDMMVGASATTSFALVLHELATNAAKYGALSSPTGHIDIEWSVGDAHLHLAWSEHGGPPVNGNVGDEGFGSVLARAMIKGQFSGKISCDWKRAGLIVHVLIPLDRLSA